MSLKRTSGSAARPFGGCATTERLRLAPLRIQLFSDLHGVSLAHAVSPAPNVDVVVCAGDVTGDAPSTFRALRDAFPSSVRIVCVLGNEAFHDQVLEEVLRSARSLAPSFDIDLIEDSAVTIGGVRFIGATFWSDFRLHGPDPDIVSAALDAAEISIVDFVRIRSETGCTFTPYASTWTHSWSRVCIGRELIAPFDGPTVVVTHHPPSARSLPSGFELDPLAPAHASSIDAVVANSGATVWMHGHAEVSADYMLGQTRVVANPCGAGRSNTGFDPDLVVEVPVLRH